jgi:hypothetical protein
MSSGARNDLLFPDLYGGVQREVAIATHSRNADGTESYATVVSELASRSLSTYFNYAKRRNIVAVRDVAYPRLSITADTPTYQPVVYTKCVLEILSAQQQFNGINNGSKFFFPSIRRSWAESGSYSDTPNYIDANHTIFDTLPHEQTRFSWFKETGDEASTSLLAIAVVPIMAFNSTVDSYQSSGIVACAVDARWAASDAYYQPMNSSTISSNVSDRLVEYMTNREHRKVSSESLKSKFAFSDKPLDIGLNWAAMLNGNQSRSRVNNNISTVTNTSAMVDFLDLPVTRLDDAITPPPYSASPTSRRRTRRVLLRNMYPY